MPLFDKVNWDYLFAIFKYFGLAEKWVSWIKGCMTYASFSVILKGSPAISPAPAGSGKVIQYHFTLLVSWRKLLAEASLRPVTMVNFNSEKGFRISRHQPVISNLQLSDDTIIFFEASISHAATIKIILSFYESTSGQTINYSKSTLFFFNPI